MRILITHRCSAWKMSRINLKLSPPTALGSSITHARRNPNNPETKLRTCAASAAFTEHNKPVDRSNPLDCDEDHTGADGIQTITTTHWSTGWKAPRTQGCRVEHLWTLTGPVETAAGSRKNTTAPTKSLHVFPAYVRSSGGFPTNLKHPSSRRAT